MEDLLAHIIDVLVLRAEHKVSLVVLMVVPGKVLFIVLFLTGIVFLSHLGPLLLVLLLEDLHPLFLIVEVLLLHYKDVDQVLGLPAFHSLLDDLDLLGVGLATFTCLTVVGISIVDPLLLLGGAQLLGDLGYTLVFTRLQLPDLLRVHLTFLVEDLRVLGEYGLFAFCDRLLCVTL